MNNEIKKDIYADVLETLIEHLRKRNDVQNSFRYLSKMISFLCPLCKVISKAVSL